MATTTVTVAAHERRIDPEQVKRAASMRHDKRTYARSIVRDWPTLTDQVRAELRAILSPVINTEGAR